MAFKFNSTTITLLLIIPLTLIFFLLQTQTPTLASSGSHKRSLLTTPKCSNPDTGLIDYACLFHDKPLTLSIPALTLTLLLHFYILVVTAQDRFSIVVTKLSAQLNLSPSMGAVTLLALGNGAPDVFASVAAVRGGQPRTGIGAILSAGTFVSAFVVGFVALYAAPFGVDPATFVRDVMFYLTAALFLFYVYLSAEIYLWQAVGFVGFYLFFVGVVFWMDLGCGGERKVAGGGEVGLETRGKKVIEEMDCESGKLVGQSEGERKEEFWLWRIYGKVCVF